MNMVVAEAGAQRGRDPVGRRRVVRRERIVLVVVISGGLGACAPRPNIRISRLSAAACVVPAR